MKYGILCAFLAACGGGGGGKTGDDDMPAPDAPDTTPTTGTVAIKINNPALASLAHLPISVAGPDGTVVAMTETDATGAASVTVTAGDSVTYAIGTAMIVTELDVHPGDQLGVDLGITAPADPSGGFVNVSAMSNASASTYKVSAGNQSTGAISPPSLLKLQLDQNITRVDLLAYAYAAGQDAPLAYVTDFDLAPPSGGIPTEALGGWRTDFDAITIGVTNAPAHAATAAFDLIPFIADRAFIQTSANKMFSNGSVGLSNSVAKGEWTSYLYRTSLTSSQGGGNAITTKTDRLAQLQGLVSIDAANELLPFLSSASLDMPTGHTTPTLHIASEAATGASPIGYLAQFVYKTATQQDITQLVVAPPGTSWDLPHMGDNQAAYAPATTGFAGTIQIAIAAGGAVWGDAAAFRSTWFAPVVAPTGLQSSALLSQFSP